MKATVIYPFYDLEDESEHVYNVGDSFPREGHKVTKERLKELSSDENKIGKPLIEVIVEEKGEETEKKTTKKKSDK